ncbi:MAG: efflux RND transporter permease subunit [Desulfobacterales bacterium]|nr:efflux RND transporter permease subunit [Desulfobacterales bacterium]
MKSMIVKFAGNHVFANILMVTLLMAGILAGMAMNREDMPSLTLDTISISVSYPGADPAEVEEGITRKVEEAIDGLEGIDEYSSASAEGSSTTTIQVMDGYDVDRLLDRVRNEVDSINSFPSEAETPSITRPEIQRPVMGLALVSDMPEARLKEWADDVKKQIQLLPGISQVLTSGTRSYEISVEISQANLLKYNLTMEQVAQSISQANLNSPGGSMKTQDREIRLRTLGRKYTGLELEKIKIIQGLEGQTLYLKDVATIKDGFTETPISIRANGSPAILLNVMAGESDAIRIADTLTAFQREFNDGLPQGSQLIILSDNTQSIRANLEMLTSNAVMGLILVFLLLWLFMDPKISFWAGMGIPISLMGGLAIVYFCGVTLNKVTLFGLIMVLGIVADDAIVVGESIFVHRKNGAGRMEAVVKGLSEVALPVIAAVLTTIVAFLPLYHINGVMGKFIVALPTAVIACLLISLVECLIMLPAHLSTLKDGDEKAKPKNRITRALDKLHTTTVAAMEKGGEKIYQPLLKKCIRHRYIFLSGCIAVLLLSTGLVTGGFVKFDVFPPQASNIMTATIRFPEGTPFTVTQGAVARVEAAARKAATQLSPDGDIIVNSLATTGQKAGGQEGGQKTALSHVGGVRITLVSPGESGVDTNALLFAWERATGTISGVQSLDFSSANGGPDGSPVEIALQGNHMDQLLGAADEIQAALKGIDGVSQVQSDNVPGKTEFRFSLKEEAGYLGITLSDLADQIYNAYYGAEALTLLRGNDEVEINVRLTQAERENLAALGEFKITTSSGAKVPLSSVARVETGPGYATINRKNGFRQIKVSAKVDTAKIVAGEVTSRLQAEEFPGLLSRYPDVKISLEGDAKRQAESFGSLGIWIPISVMGMFIIIATMFRSYIQPLLILTTIPFGLVGAVIGHLIMGKMLSLLSVFGMVALTGVVVNDAIVLIERINMNLEEGMEFFPALYQGCARRFRAVMLTSISTIGGLIPLIIETNQYAQQLIPMGISLAFGVAFATLLTLLLLPCLFTMVSDLRSLVGRILRKPAKARHQLEPAFKRNRNNQPIHRSSHATDTL